MVLGILLGCEVEYLFGFVFYYYSFGFLSGN